jgi:transglutaminase-like putative cysteine protease
MKGSDLTPGDQFTVVSEARDVTLDEMRSATTDNPPRSLYLALHDSVDDTVHDLAAGATASAPTDADKMIALQNWFRSKFTYGVTAPADRSRDAIATFLTTRRGNCQPVATTFAVMARTLGIPSRVAVGFTPGELDADGAYTVFGRHSHAWPEVWFDGIGWVPFEPTPHHSIPGAEDSTETNATAQSLE